jgi:hypothetical protein
MVPRRHIPHAPHAGLSDRSRNFSRKFLENLDHESSFSQTSLVNPPSPVLLLTYVHQTIGPTLTDPTTSAYARIDTLGTPRSHVAHALLVPGLDIVADAAYSHKIDAWATLRDCYDGERTIKNAGTQYLPQLKAHTPTDYETYKERAYFYNAVRRTHRGLMGSIFRKPVELTLPASMKDKLNLGNISQDKQSFAAFCRSLGHEVLLTGRFGVLADFKGNNWQTPYLAGYLAENIYSWRIREWRDRMVVDRVVLLEREVVSTTYGYNTQLLVRVLRLDEQNGDLVYSQTEIRPAQVPEDQPQPLIKDIPVSVRGGRRLNYIPFVFVNATNLSCDVGPAPLEDIASINISHYRSTAHLEHGRFYAGMPTYVTAGDGSKDLVDQIAQASGAAGDDPRYQGNQLAVGPQFVWELEKDAKAYLLEFTGHGLTFLENAVDSKQLQMQSLGGRLISSTRRAAAVSDEAWQLLETGDEATLMDVAATADEGMSLAVAYLGDIMGNIPDITKHGVAVEFNKEFVRSELTARELRALQALRERGHIPEDVMYYALREVGVVPIEYTLEDFQTLMARKDQQYEPPLPPASGGLDTGPPGSQPPAGTGSGVRPNPNPAPANSGAG